jgi:hypothetical protein
MPRLLAPFAPGAFIFLVNVLVLLLVLRRVWLLVARREGVPQSYAGVAKILGHVGAWSFLLAVAGFLLSVSMRVGSGVPAAMLAWPALLCVPWAFSLAEIMSLRRAPSAT